MAHRTEVRDPLRSDRPWSWRDFVVLLYALLWVHRGFADLDRVHAVRSSYVARAEAVSARAEPARKPRIATPRIVTCAWPSGERVPEPGPFVTLEGVMKFLEESIVKNFRREEKIKAQLIDDGKAVIVRMPVERLFAPSGAEVRADRRRFLEDLGWVIGTYRVMIEVDHRIELPLGDPQVGQDDLTTRRSNAVVRVISKADAATGVNVVSRVCLEEFGGGRPAGAEPSRSVFEFRFTR